MICVNELLMSNMRLPPIVPLIVCALPFQVKVRFVYAVCTGLVKANIDVILL